MSLYEKAFKILQTDSFDRKRYMAAIKLYRKAKGQEKYDIGQLFESQLSLADREDVNWVSSISHLLD